MQQIPGAADPTRMSIDFPNLDQPLDISLFGGTQPVSGPLSPNIEQRANRRKDLRKSMQAAGKKGPPMVGRGDALRQTLSPSFNSPNSSWIDSFELPKAYQCQKTLESAKYNEYLKRFGAEYGTDALGASQNPLQPRTELGIMQADRTGSKRHVYGYHNLGQDVGAKPANAVMDLIAKSYNTSGGLGPARRQDPRGSRVPKIKTKLVGAAAAAEH